MAAARGVVPVQRRRCAARAATLFQKACDGGHAQGCLGIGFAYFTGRGILKDEGRAAGYYQKACDANVADGCTRLASMYEQGQGVPRDKMRAANLYQRGRDLIGRTTDSR